MAKNTVPEDQLDDSSAPLIEHLAELRSRLIWSVLAFVVAMVLCYTVWKPIYNFLTEPICHALETRGQNCQLQIIKLQEGFFTAINISFFGGFVLAFPVIGYQLWRFVAPGLYRSEKAAFLPFLLAFGLSFQLPVALTLLGKAGLVSSAGLASVRRYAVVGILILAAVATPPDVISQIVLFVVIFALYEVSIQLVRRIEKRREAELRAQGLWVEDEDEETNEAAK